jgi:hypothetical protein
MLKTPATLLLVASPNVQFEVLILPELMVELFTKLVATPTQAAPGVKLTIGLGAELMINLKLLLELLFIVKELISQFVSFTLPEGAN